MIVFSHAGKATDKHKNSSNILKEGSQKQTPIDMDDVAVERLDQNTEEPILLPMEEDSGVFVVKDSENPKVVNAKKAEIQKFQEFNVD